MSESATALYAKLVNLRNETGQRHYDRVALAAELLARRDWVEDPAGGGGDESKAIDRLESECFGDLCGVVGVVQLLEVYHHVPKLADWQKHKFDLKKIWAEWKSAQKPERKPPRTDRTYQRRPVMDPAAWEQLSPAKARSEYERTFVRAETLQGKVERLAAENEELRAENAGLREEIKGLKQGARKLFKIA